MNPFPNVQPGGSLIIAWQLKNRNVLVIGGGEVASSRTLHALNSDANVNLVCPKNGLSDELAYRISAKQINHIDRKFQPEDLENMHMVLCAVDDPIVSTQVYTLCKEHRIPVNVADVPQECDFYFGSVYRDGPLQIMISTNGNGPKLSNLVRNRIADCLPSNAGMAIGRVGNIRCKLRDLVPQSSFARKRMSWMSRLCETWSFDDLCAITDEETSKLLSYFDINRIPSLLELRNCSSQISASELSNSDQPTL